MLGRRTWTCRRTERGKMNGRELTCLLLLFAVAVHADDSSFDTSNLYIDGTTVTLTCPGESPKWTKDGKTPDGEPTENALMISNYKDTHNGLYNCTTGDKTYYFYTKLKVCEGCVDLDMGWATMIVIGDILVTLGVILIVYLCAKKKAGPAPRQRATPGRQAGAPPPPNPDYQVLNPATRSRDVYAEAVRKH
ncbi:hypothetical protein MHYP_G00206420 [Metynnis hypsauchen]